MLLFIVDDRPYIIHNPLNAWEYNVHAAYHDGEGYRAGNKIGYFNADPNILVAYIRYSVESLWCSDTAEAINWIVRNYAPCSHRDYSFHSGAWSCDSCGMVTERETVSGGRGAYGDWHRALWNEGPLKADGTY